MPILFDNQGHKDILEPKEIQREEKKEIIPVKMPEREARKKINDFVISIQNLPKIFDSSRIPFLGEPGLFLFLRNSASTPCRRLLMKFDFWYKHESSKRFKTDSYFSEATKTGERAHRYQFLCSVFKIVERPCLVFCEVNVEPLNYIVVPSAALDILMCGGKETRLFAVLDFLDLFWSAGFSPFQMKENTIRTMLTWVSVGRASRKKPKNLWKKALWRYFRINRVPFAKEMSSNGGPTVK